MTSEGLGGVIAAQAAAADQRGRERLERPEKGQTEKEWAKEEKAAAEENQWRTDALRGRALELASHNAATAASGEQSTGSLTPDAVVKRAEAYYEFLKGGTDG